MQAHRMKIVIPENHSAARQSRVHRSGRPATSPRKVVQIDNLLDTLAAGAAESPVIPLKALRRENLYE